MKKMKYLNSILALGFVSGVAHADFNTELGATAVKSDDLKVYGIGGSYYFDRVNTAKGPLAEATFLDKQSSVDATLMRVKIGDNHANAWVLGGTYMQQDTGLYVNAAVSHINGYSQDSYNFGGGYYLSSDWAVSIDTQFDEDLDYQAVTLGSKKLFNLGSEHYFSLEGSYTNPDQGDDSFEVAGDFYLDRSLSVGLGYAWADSFSDGETSIRSQWFINNQFAVSAQISHADYPGNSDNTYSVGATMRF